MIKRWMINILRAIKIPHQHLPQSNKDLIMHENGCISFVCKNCNGIIHLSLARGESCDICDKLNKKDENNSENNH